MRSGGGIAEPVEVPATPRVARILLDSALPQLDHLFDYAVPESLAGELRVGQRVRVPFRSQSRRSHGYVIELVERSEFEGELQPIAEIVGPVAVLTPEVWRLARAVSDRAAGSAGDILRLAIPQRMVRVEKQHLAALAETSEAGTGATSSTDGTEGAAERAAENATEGTTDAATAVAAGPHSEPDLARLLIGGERVCITASHGPERLETGEWVGGWAVRLARAALDVFALGRSAIIVAPDYRDLDQLRDAFEALGHDEAVLVSARQSNGERYAHFLRALDARPRIVLGNRSAVYAPAHRLGALFVWDDGDPVLAEPRSPYVHARDAALVRAEQSGAGLCFMAHARSAEVQRLVDLGYVKSEKNPPRRTRVVHADASVAPEAFAGRVPEFAARAIRAGLERGPVLVQVATPGYAPVAICGDCGELARCAECGGPLGFRSAGRGACRWCGRQAGAWRCPECGGPHLEQRGMGSRRTVEQFQRQFSGARVLLSDGDHPLERLDSRPALVVATRGAEPIAAGGYAAVVLLDVERLLSIETLRAGEDCMRWWQNAAALTMPDGRVVVASGGGPVVRAFVTGRDEEWLRGELRDRHALRYPPAVRVASVTGGSAEVDRALDAIRGLRGVDVLGPAPFHERSQASSPDAEPGSMVDALRGGSVTDGSKTDGSTVQVSTAALQRAIVRFEYARGAEVAQTLRAVLVADAAGASSRVTGRRPGRPRPGALRLRFDDRGVFDA